MKLYLLLFFGLLFVPHPTFGDTCPTAANYYNLSHKLVALTDVSIGIIAGHCFYVAPTSCADTNAGTKASPWCHAPGMPGFTGSHTLTKGDAYLFKGGGTWHFGNPALLPYTGGAWVTNAVYGSATNEIYFGVDSTFFIGASWTRPILTGDNPLTVNIVTTCPRDNGLLPAMVTIGDYQIFDNFELTGFCTMTKDPQVLFFYVRGIHNTLNHSELTNTYMHGSSSNCTLGTLGVGSCHDRGQINVFSSISHVWNNVFDFSDSYAGMLSWVASDAPGDDIAYNYLNYFGQGIGGFANVLHDNTYENFTTGMHPNVYEVFTYATTTGAVYNNVIRNTCSQAVKIPGATVTGCNPGTVFVADFPSVGHTNWYFNNVFYGISTQIGNYFALTNHAGVSDGTLDVFNNTMEYFDNGSMMNCLSGAPSTNFLTNNYYVDDVSPYNNLSGCSPVVTPLTELNDTHSGSSTNTTSVNFQYFPKGTGALVGTGTNNQAKCSAISSSAASNPALADAATACLSDTTYGVIYNKSNHTVSWPARTVTVRPVSGAWDIGAYEFSGTTPTPAISFSPNPLPLPNPVVGTGGAGAPITISNPGTATTTITSITISGPNASSFSEVSSTCSALPISISAGGNCNIIVNFNPPVVGAYFAAINFFDNVAGSPQAVNLSGNGTAPNVPSPAGVFGAANLAGCAVCTGTAQCFCFTQDRNIYVSQGKSSPYTMFLSSPVIR